MLGEFPVLLIINFDGFGFEVLIANHIDLIFQLLLQYGFIILAHGHVFILSFILELLSPGGLVPVDHFFE